MKIILKLGTLESPIMDYEPSPGGLYRMAVFKPVFSLLSGKSIEALVATESHTYRFVFHDSGELRRYNDEWVNVYTFKEIED